MNKKTLFTIGMLGVLTLTGCGKDKNTKPVDPADNTDDPGTIIHTTGDWDKLLEKDYTNSTVYSYVSIGETESYVYNLEAGKYMNSYLIGEEMYSQFFMDYNGENYVYWDCTHDASRPNGKKGWINYNDKYEANLSLEHQDFYYPNLYKITKDMVEYDTLFQEYYVKDEYVAQVSALLFGYAWDNNAEAISIQTTSDNRGNEILSKIWAFDDLEKGEDAPFVMVQFGYIGSTATPTQVGFPEEINEENIFDYWEITGEEYEAPTFPEGILMSIVSEHDTESGYDAVMTVGDTLEFKYEYTNDGVNKYGINTFNPDASNYRDDEGNYYDSFYDLVGAFNIETCWDSHCSYFQARNAGDIEVYVTYEYPGHEKVTSNKLKVKVNPQKEQEISENTIYEINPSTYVDEYNDPVWGAESGYYQTVMHGTNSKEQESFHPVFDMTGYLVRTLEGRYTETFTDLAQVFDFQLGSSSSYGVAYGLEKYLEFDFADQEVTSLSFMYSLHTSGQLASMKSNLKTALIATSSDGKTWNTVKDMKEEMFTELGKDSYMAGLTNHLMEASFEKTSHVRIYFDASTFGQYFEVCLANVAFDKDETCAMHVDGPRVAVTGVSIVEDAPVVRVGNVTQLSAVLNPSNATNKKIYWTSADHTIAQVNQKGEIKGIKEGKTKIKVYTDELDGDGLAPYYDEVEIEVLGPATLPATLTADDFYTYTTTDTKYTLQVSNFNVAKGTMDVTYIRLNRAYNVTLTLVNEDNGVYTATNGEDNILVFGFENGTNTMTINPQSSKIKTFSINTEITALTKEVE